LEGILPDLPFEGLLKALNFFHPLFVISAGVLAEQIHGIAGEVLGDLAKFLDIVAEGGDLFPELGGVLAERRLFGGSHGILLFFKVKDEEKSLLLYGILRRISAQVNIN
jgi:hypothetical protein